MALSSYSILLNPTTLYTVDVLLLVEETQMKAIIKTVAGRLELILCPTAKEFVSIRKQLIEPGEQQFRPEGNIFKSISVRYP